MKYCKTTALLAVFAFLSGSAAMGSTIDYDYAGTLPSHNSVLRFNFGVSDVSTVTLFSSSWDDGGFDPILALWRADGTLIFQQDDGHRVGSTSSNGVSYTHGNWDSYFQSTVNAGQYIVTIGVYNNWARGSNLSDGFAFDNQSGVAIENWNQPANGYRTSNFAFHILGVESASGPSAVPEPGTVGMLSGGILAGCLFLRRRRVQS